MLLDIMLNVQEHPTSSKLREDGCEISGSIFEMGNTEVYRFILLCYEKGTHAQSLQIICGA